ncbi:MAG: MFS transporter [Dehalococcoidia bacterium]
MATAAGEEVGIGGGEGRPFAALRYRDYRLLWLGTVLSFATNPLRFSGGILFLTNSAPDDTRLLLAGVLGAVIGVVTILVGLGGGALADHFERRRLLIGSQVVVIIATAATALVMAADVNALTLTAFFVFVFISAGALSIDLPTRQALVAELVPPQHLANAIALDSVAMMLVLPLSLPLAGVLIDTLGYAGAYGCSVVGFVGVLLSAYLISPQPPPAAPPRAFSLVSDVREGLRYVLVTPSILWVLLLLFGVMAVGFPLVAQFGPVWVTEVLDLSATEFGFFAATWGLGAITASLAMTRVGHFPAKGWVLIGAVLVFAISVVIWSYSRWVPLSALVNFSLGASITLAQISARSLVQRIVPAQLQGRVMSLFLLNIALAQISALPVGALAQLFSLSTVTVVGGWLVLLLALAIAFGRREVRRAGETAAALA